MGTKTLVLSLIGLGFVFQSQVFADPNPTPTPTELNYQGYHLALPPTPGSLEDLGDMAEVHHQQDIRSDAECAEAQIENTLTFENIFGPHAGVLTEAEVQLANAVATKVFTEAATVAGYYKSHFKRDRPYVQDSTVHPCVSLPGGYSYPSTHSTTGYAMALTLADLFPEKSGIILQQGDLIGEYRIIGGVHFPSDVEAGRELGKEIYDVLKASPTPHS